MKIAIVLPTRGNPERCAAILTALDHLSSGQHEIEYHLVMDSNDNAVYARVNHGLGIVHTGDPAINLYTRINQVVRELDADAVSAFCDDVFPLAMHWDALIALGIGEHKLPAFAWQELNDPGNVTYPVLSRRWLDALGYMFPEHFPFWFADTWLIEVHELAFGQTFPVVSNLPLGGRRGLTRGMHELRFWFEFFDATYPERQGDAMLLAEAFGTTIAPEQRSDIVAKHREQRQAQLERVPEYEKAYGADMGPMSERYLKSKAAAIEWLQNSQRAVHVA